MPDGNSSVFHQYLRGQTLGSTEKKPITKVEMKFDPNTHWHIEKVVVHMLRDCADVLDDSTDRGEDLTSMVSRLGDISQLLIIANRMRKAEQDQ